jgi:hypothetical protein
LFKVKNKLLILLHVSLAFVFFGCDISNKNQAYISSTSEKEALIHPKIQKDIKEEEKTNNALFINETIINSEKLQEKERKVQSSLGKWWLLAIPISIFIVIYYIKLLMRKQKIILEKMEEHNS